MLLILHKWVIHEFEFDNGDFLLFPPPIKLTATIYYNWNIVESGHNPNPPEIYLSSEER
jgi:hypothetical protein